MIGSPRATSAGVSSRRARRETRRAQKVRGSKGQGSSPRNANGGRRRTRVARGEGRLGFYRQCALAKGSRESSHSGSRHGAKAVRAETTKGGAAGRRMRVQRVARILGPHYHAPEHLGAADGLTVAGLPWRARTMAYGCEADMAERDVVCARVPHVLAPNNSG
jgi:hypothetical protein